MKKSFYTILIAVFFAQCSTLKVTTSLESYGIKEGATENVQNTLKIQAALDAAPLYSDIIIPKGKYYISDAIYPREGQRLIFNGSLKLNDNGKAVLRMISLKAPNVQLINPILDMDRDNNTFDNLSGTQAIISNYGKGFNCKVTGGKLINGIDNFFQGGRTGLIFDGTVFENCGEHAFYVNGIDPDGNYGDLTFRNLDIKNVALDASHSEGHCFQFRNSKNITVENVNFDANNPAIPSFCFLIDLVTNLKVTNFKGKNFTHRFAWANKGSEDIYFDRINLDNSGIAYKGVSNFAIDSSIKNCSITNSVFKKCLITGKIPRLFDNCKMIDLWGEVSNSHHVTIRNSSINSLGQSRVLRLNSSALIDNVEITGTPKSVGIYIHPSATESVTITNCKIDVAVSNPILADSGTDHIITNNEILTSTGVKKIRLSSNVNGVSVITGNNVKQNPRAIEDLTKKAIIRNNQ